MQILHGGFFMSNGHIYTLLKSRYPLSMNFLFASSYPLILNSHLI